MQRLKQLVLVTVLSISLGQTMATSVYGQHPGGCTCSQCMQSAQSQNNYAVQAATSSPINQTVLLDFDSGTDGTINYSQAMRDDVMAQLENIYAAFGVDFVQSAPTAAGAQFSTLTFNSGPLGGIADGVDFRNLNRSDNAVINIGGTTVNTNPSNSEVVNLAANVAAHELGHLLGLSHRDAFGPIGGGLPAGATGDFFPLFPGPTNSTEFSQHVLQTPGLGAARGPFEQPDVFFSERSAIKLSAINQLSTTNETAASNDSIATAQAILFDTLIVPNTITTGQNAGIGDFDVDAVSIIGDISDVNDVDVFSFEGEAGDLFNFEVISQFSNRFNSDLDSTLSIFDSSGNFLDYFGTDAFGDEGVESSDAILFDLVLQTSGTFFVQIETFDGAIAPTTSGNYELFFTRFNGAITAVPEPGATWALMLVAGVAASWRRR